MAAEVLEVGHDWLRWAIALVVSIYGVLLGWFYRLTCSRIDRIDSIQNERMNKLEAVQAAFEVAMAEKFAESAKDRRELAEQTAIISTRQNDHYTAIMRELDKINNVLVRGVSNG